MTPARRGRALDGFRSLEDDTTSEEAPRAAHPGKLAEPGKTIAGRYVLSAPISRGTLGQVWKATDGETGGLVALKLVPRLGAETWERFRREAAIGRGLDSAHFASPYASGETHDLAYFAMELLEGEDLAKRLDREGYLSARECIEVVDSVAAGLAVAHRSKIVHRDIKPKNVFLEKTGEGVRIKILDFGIAKQAAIEARVTRSGVLLGTPHYMSPEQIADVRSVDWRSDLWSLGAVAYRCLVGRRPFEASGLSELLSRIVDHPPPAPTSIRPDLPPAVDAFFQRALAKDPSDRFADAPLLAAAFRRAF